MEHSKPLFLDLKIFNIYQINDYLCSLFMYRRNYCQNLTDFYNDYFKQNNDVHNYNTRNSTTLHVSYKRTNYRIQLFQLRLSTSKAEKSNTSAKGCWESLTN